jgi:hypothetical protein
VPFFKKTVTSLQVTSDHEEDDQPRLGGAHPDLNYLGGRDPLRRTSTQNSIHSTLAGSTRGGASNRSGGVVDWDRTVPGTARWERTLWKKLEVGDVVLLRDDEQVPADIVRLPVPLLFFLLFPAFKFVS